MKNQIIKKFLPFLDWIPLVNRSTIRHDVIAGLTGAVVALPQGVAFAMIAGMPPIYGLYTAIIVPIITALYGSSHHMISGPATAISIVIYSSISPYAEPGTQSFVELALLLTIMTGIIQWVMGIARLGSLVNFVSHTVIIGFTAGAAILIGFSQLKHVLGISVSSGSSILETTGELWNNAGEFNIYVFAVGMATLISAIAIKKISPKIPYMLLAMIIGGVVSYFLGGESVGIELVGEMPSGLPPFHVPEFSFELFRKLSSSAFAIALLGLIEAVAIARSIAVQSNQYIDGNREFIGQGISNTLGGFFSCHAASGSFTRSGVNHQAGARTPMASIFAGVFLLVIILFVAPFTAYLPMPAMGGLILLVASNLIDIKHIREILKISNRESTVLILTLLATLFLELEFAIYIGVIFSLVFYLRATSKPRIIKMVVEPDQDYLKLANHKRHPDSKLPKGLKILRIDGTLFFGAVEHVQNLLEEQTKGFTGILLLDFSGVSLIDMSGAELLIKLSEKYEEKGIELHICNMRKAVKHYMRKGNYKKLLKGTTIHKDEYKALISILDTLYNLAQTPEDKQLIHSYSNRIGQPK